MCWLAKHLLTVNIAYHMVDVTFEHHDFRITALYELLHQVVNIAFIHINGIDFSTRNHTVTDLRIRKIECILKNLHLIVNFIIGRCTVN